MVDEISSYNLLAVHMDRMTKVTLWVAFLVLGSYFVWAFLDCAMDDTCHRHRSCPSNQGIMLPRLCLRLFKGKRSMMAARRTITRAEIEERVAFLLRA
jgi:hypothetical protein